MLSKQKIAIWCQEACFISIVQCSFCVPDANYIYWQLVSHKIAGICHFPLQHLIGGWKMSALHNSADDGHVIERNVKIDALWTWTKICWDKSIEKIVKKFTSTINRKENKKEYRKLVSIIFGYFNHVAIVVLEIDDNKILMRIWLSENNFSRLSSSEIKHRTKTTENIHAIRIQHTLPALYAYCTPCIYMHTSTPCRNELQLVISIYSVSVYASLWTKVHASSNVVQYNITSRISP